MIQMKTKTANIWENKVGSEADIRVFQSDNLVNVFPAMDSFVNNQQHKNDVMNTVQMLPHDVVTSK